jgi:hypothetical protein
MRVGNHRQQVREREIQAATVCCSLKKGGPHPEHPERPERPDPKQEDITVDMLVTLDS